MIGSGMDTVPIVKKNNNSVITRLVEIREPQANEVGRRVCRFQVRQTGVKRRSRESAVLALRRNSALANFSKIFVFKRQLYRHRI